MVINFNSECVELPCLDQDKIRDWVCETARQHGKIVGSINYIFTDDETILRINREFLNHDYFTDIITFDYSRRKLISGDLYISLDTVCSNAEMLGVPYESELHRVIIHGVLHLCGIDDKGPGEREIMEHYENEALNRLNA